MHIRTILAIARKDAIDILLNKSTLFLLLTPIFLALVFFFISTLIGSHTDQLLIYDPGGSSMEQAISGAFTNPQIVQANSAADVAAAFGPDGSHKSSSYALGLVIPAGFDSSLSAGSHPQVNLYLNGDDINNQEALLLRNTVSNYARAVASPQPPITLTSAIINPPSNMNIGVDLGKSYAATSLLVSFLVGSALMPGLLIEEKEKKTIRVLMVSPASFNDIVLGKLLIVLVYQLILSGIVLAIQGGYTGQVALVLLYALLGSCFGLALGLLFGCIFQTTAAAGGVGGIVGFIYILPGIFIGQLGQLIGSNPVAQAIKILPTYYVADGAYNALTSQSTLSGNLLDVSVIVASTIVILAIAVWILRRQAAVAAAI